MTATTQGTDTDHHECPDCEATLEHNVELDWETAPLRSPANYAPLVKCGSCGYAAGGAYGSETAYELLETVGIDIEEATPGERVEPGLTS